MGAPQLELSDIIARAEAMDTRSLEIDPGVKDQLVEGLKGLADAGRGLFHDLLDLISSVLDVHGMGREIVKARKNVFEALLPDQK